MDDEIVKLEDNMSQLESKANNESMPKHDISIPTTSTNLDSIQPINNSTNEINKQQSDSLSKTGKQYFVKKKGIIMFYERLNRVLLHFIIPLTMILCNNIRIRI